VALPRVLAHTESELSMARSEEKRRFEMRAWLLPALTPGG
jgi:hypothetical protein